MIETHTIRLRGPWDCKSTAIAKRVRMPATLRAIIDGDYEGRLLCRRRFGGPTCLDPHERVWLIVERPALSGEADLNGERLGPIRQTDRVTGFDITGRLRERNELVLDFDVAAATAARSRADILLFADVRLEIRG